MVNSCTNSYLQVKRKTRENASRGREVQQPSVDNRESRTKLQSQDVLLGKERCIPERTPLWK